jgi:hypothetical protein
VNVELELLIPMREFSTTNMSLGPVLDSVIFKDKIWIHLSEELGIVREFGADCCQIENTSWYHISYFYI